MAATAAMTAPAASPRAPSAAPTGSGLTGDAALDIAKNPLATLTAELLAWGWRTLIPTFGLTLLYLNFHFVMRYLAGSQKFSPFGQALRFGKVKIGGKGAEFAEIIGMLVLDVLAVIALAIVLIAALLAAIPILLPVLGPSGILDLFNCDILHLAAPVIGGAWGELASLCPGP